MFSLECEVLSWQQVLNDRRVRRGVLQVTTRGRVYEGRLQSMGEDSQQVWFTAAILPCVGGAKRDESCLFPYVYVSKKEAPHKRQGVINFEAILGDVCIFPDNYGELEMEPHHTMGGEIIFG